MSLKINIFTIKSHFRCTTVEVNKVHDRTQSTDFIHWGFCQDRWGLLDLSSLEDDPEEEPEDSRSSWALVDAALCLGEEHQDHQDHEAWVLHSAPVPSPLHRWSNSKRASLSEESSISDNKESPELVCTFGSIWLIAWSCWSSPTTTKLSGFSSKSSSSKQGRPTKGRSKVRLSSLVFFALQLSQPPSYTGISSLGWLIRMYGPCFHFSHILCLPWTPTFWTSTRSPRVKTELLAVSS